MLFYNLSFLYYLLPLAAIPLLIHLLHRKYPKTFLFSNTEYIRKSLAQRSKLLRMRHIILVIVRTLMIICLIIVFLKPFLDLFGTKKIAKNARHVLIVLDHSLSMQYQGENLNPSKKALLEVGKIIDSLDRKDELNLILATKHPQLAFSQFTQNYAKVHSYVSNLPIGLTATSMKKTTALAARQFSKIKGPKEIYYISDFQRKNWADIDFGKLPPDTRLFFVNVGANIKANRAILKAKSNLSTILSGENVPVEIILGNFSNTSFEDKLQLTIDNRSVFYQNFVIAPWTIKHIRANITLDSPGIHTCKISLPKDNLIYDNHYFLSLKVLEKEEVVLLSDATGERHESVFYLKTALNPFKNLAGPLIPKVVDSASISEIHLAATSRLLVTGVHRLSSKTCSLLANFLQNGGGIIYFLDGAFDAENLAQINTFLGGKSPLKLTTFQNTENIPGGVQKFWRGNFKSKFLQVFAGNMRKTLATLEFYNYYHGVTTGKGSILLSYTDGSTAMASVNIQLGTLLLCNFSIAETSSNLARQRIFPAWLQHMVKNLEQSGQSFTNHTLGDIVHTEIWKKELQNNFLLAPDGKKVNVKKFDMEKERLNIVFPLTKQGFYTLKQQHKLLYAFSSNCDSEEADLRSMDMSSIARRASKWQAYAVNDPYKFFQSGKPIFHYFLFAVLFFLLLETILFNVFKAK